MEAVRKITVREILKGKPQKGEDGKVASQDLALIYGQVHSLESGTSQFGNYQVLIGRFEARRLKDGAVFQSTRAILPQIAEDLAVQTVMEAKAQDPSAFVNLAFVIGAEHDERGTEGYKFTVKPVSTGEQAADPLAELRASMMPALAAIGGPVASVLAITDGTGETEASKSSKKKETSAA